MPALKRHVAAIAVAAGVAALFAFVPSQTHAAMSDAELKARIGQMLIVGFNGTSTGGTSTIAQQVRDLNLGGVILYLRNIVDPAQVHSLTADLQREASTTLLVSVDVEGGYVNRLKANAGFIDLPSAAQMGKGSAAQTEQVGDIVGQELRLLGFNVNFAPVVDVNVNPDNPVIGYLDRSFSAGSAGVTEHARAFMRGQSKSGVVSVIKHFPGHGSSEKDSHLGFVDITRSYEKKELEPFRDLIASGDAAVVMTAHVANRFVDRSYPATLSRKFLQDALRDKLGFNGVIVSDDMQMGAITQNYTFEKAVVRAVRAGNDMLILSNNKDAYDEHIAEKARDVIFQAVREGKIGERRIMEISERIAALKQQIR